MKNKHSSHYFVETNTQCHIPYKISFIPWGNASLIIAQFIWQKYQYQCCVFRQDLHIESSFRQSHRSERRAYECSTSYLFTLNCALLVYLAYILPIFWPCLSVWGRGPVLREGRAGWREWRGSPNARGWDSPQGWSDAGRRSCRCRCRRGGAMSWERSCRRRTSSLLRIWNSHPRWYAGRRGPAACRWSRWVRTAAEWSGTPRTWDDTIVFITC